MKSVATPTGTTPPGTENEEQAASWVQQMFAAVAPRYDLLNHLLSFNIDKGWRKRLIERVRPVLAVPDAVILDLCCGTGDVLLEMQQHAASNVLGADFCHPMLTKATEKIAAREFRSRLFEADGLRLPLRENSLDLITIAFGFRNFANYQIGLAELARVLKPGGQVAILEFSHPRSWVVGASYGFYSKVVLPLIGGAISGSREAYTYLPESIEKFPRAEELREMMRRAGFVDAGYELLTGGIAALHLGWKASEAGLKPRAG
ncbi:MAG: bifunctional demethylmenaquinone methyltransferase/2-methoxy-6-polyprenyl-1,4-benzoquinol methylase UbiE [Bryobacteraceae bacterium]